MISEIELQAAIEALKKDEVIVYPTETAYGLGVNARSEKALKKLYDLKGRDEKKPTHISVLNIESANEFAEVDRRARFLAEAFLPGPLTLVLPTRGVLPKPLEESGGIERGIRVPDHPVARMLLMKSELPITAPSANMSGGATPYSIDMVKESFGSKFDDIAVVLDVGTLPQVTPSTILSLMNPEYSILREGPITKEQIGEVLTRVSKI